MSASKNDLSIYFDEHKIEADHGQKSLRGGALSIIARAVNALIQVGSVLFLARLLSPEDYGLVSMVTAITGFAPLLVDLGTRDAIAQRSRITKAEVSTLFWVTIAVGLVCALAVTASGSFIAKLYHEPRLTSIALVSSLTFVAVALNCQHYALIRRAMKFRELCIIDLTANLLSVIGAVIMGFYGFHHWALVLRPITQNLVTALGVWSVCRWLPTQIQFTSGVKQMLKVGIHITGFTMTDFAGRSGDRIVIGKTAGAAALGYYQNAMFVYDNVLDVLVATLHGVAVTSLSKMRENLPELKRMWSKAMATLSFFSMPAFGILAITSQDLISIVLGPKWMHAGELLSLLALRGIPNVVERTVGWLHVAAGRTDRWVRWGVVANIATILSLFAGAPFGPTGIVIAYVACMFIISVPAIAYAGQPLHIRAQDVIAAVWRPLLGTLLGVVTGFLLRYTTLMEQEGVVRILAFTSAFVFVYFVTVVGILRVRTPLHVVLKLARDAGPAKLSRFIPVPSLISETTNTKTTAAAVGGGSTQDATYTPLPENPQFVPGRLPSGEVHKSLTGFERTLASIEENPWAALYRLIVGFVALPIVSIAWTGQASAVATVATLVGILLALRFLPMVFRGAISFSKPLQRVWDDRRQAAKRYDSYQWRKLFWFGAGLLAYIALTGQFGVTNVSLGAMCVVSGAIGILRWRAINSQARPSDKN